MATHEGTLTLVWQRARDRIQTVYGKYYIQPKMIVNKTEAANKVRDGDIQKNLRKILTDAAHQVRIQFSNLSNPPD